MIDKYQRIRDALAMGPTPGPLFVVNGTDVFTALGSPNAQGTHSDEDDGWHVADCLGGETYVNGELMSLTYGESKANAHFFAACDPDTIRGLLAERDALRAKTSLSLGVGDGAGNLFVYGDHDSIMRVQALIFECEKLRKDAERYRWLRPVPSGPEAQRIVNNTPEGMDAAIDRARQIEEDGE